MPPEPVEPAPLRRAKVVPTDAVADHIAKLTPADAFRLHRVLVSISVDPEIGTLRPCEPGQVPLREHTEDRIRTLYFKTALGSVLILAFVEVD